MYMDKNIVNQFIELVVDDGLTNSIHILSRPKLVADESGENPGEMFNEVFLTRGELLRMLFLLEEDWRKHSVAVRGGSYDDTTN